MSLFANRSETSSGITGYDPIYGKVIKAKAEFVKNEYPERYNYELEAMLENSKDKFEYTEILIRINKYYGDWLEFWMDDEGTISFRIYDSALYDVDSETLRKKEAFVSQAAQDIVLKKLRELAEATKDSIDGYEIKRTDVWLDIDRIRVVPLEDGSYGYYCKGGIVYYYPTYPGNEHFVDTISREIGIIIK